MEHIQSDRVEWFKLCELFDLAAICQRVGLEQRWVAVIQSKHRWHRKLRRILPWKKLLSDQQLDYAGFRAVWHYGVLVLQLHVHCNDDRDVGNSIVWQERLEYRSGDGSTAK